MVDAHASGACSLTGVEVQLLSSAQYMKLCTLYLIRHGETEWNAQHRIQGNSDSPLTETGIEQARRRAESLKHLKFAAVYSSDLLRAKRTAEIIALDHKLVVKTSELLRERNFGRNEGKKYSEYQQEFGELLEKRVELSDQQHDDFSLYEGYETDSAIASRFIQKLRELALAHAGETIAIVTHGGALRVLLRKFGYATFSQLNKGSINNTAYIILESDGVEFTITETEGVELAELDG